MKKTMLTAAAALSVLAFPVAADAKRGGHGHTPPEHAASQHGAGDSRPAEQRSEGRRAARKCKRTHSIGFVAKGSLVSFTDETVTLDVKRANRHAASYIEDAGSTFTLGTARVKFAGVTDTGSGTLDLADVASTDKVVAKGKLTAPKRGCEGETVLTLRKLQIVRPEADEAEGTKDES